MTRIRAVGWAIAVVAGLLAAAPAQAFVLIGPTQVPNAQLTQDINIPDQTLAFNQAAPSHVRLRSPIDGVITSWRTYSGFVNDGNTLQLRVLSDEGGGNYRVLRSGPLEPVLGEANGKATEYTFKARIPIPAGALIGVQRARPAGSGSANLITVVHDQPDPSNWLQGWYFGDSNPPPADGAAAATDTRDGTPGGSDPFFPNTAVVEPDADHDGFGDETQDRCPSAAGGNSGCPGDAFEVPAAPAQGATVLGPSFDINPANVVLSNRLTSVVFNFVPAPGTQTRARFRGVVTSWSFFTGVVTAGASAQLRVLREIATGEYQAVTSGPVEPLTAGAGTASQRTFASRVPVLPGDELAVGLTRPAGGTLQITAVKSELSPPQWHWGHFGNDTGNNRIPNDGESSYPRQQDVGPALSGTFLPITAVVERDSDGDLFGDNTEDRCLNSAGPIAGCPAPTPPPDEPKTTVQVNTVVASAGAIIDTKNVRFTSRRKKLRVPISCPQQPRPCTARLAARTTGKFKVGTGRKARNKFLSLGGASFSIAPGKTKTLYLRVPRSTRSALEKVKQLALTLTISAVVRVPTTARSSG